MKSLDEEIKERCKKKNLIDEVKELALEVDQIHERLYDLTDLGNCPGAPDSDLNCAHLEAIFVGGCNKAKDLYSKLAIVHKQLGGEKL